MKTSLAVAAGMALGVLLPFTPLRQHAAAAKRLAVTAPQQQLVGTWPIIDIQMVGDYRYVSALSKAEHHTLVRIHSDIEISQSTFTKLEPYVAAGDFDNAYKVLCNDPKAPCNSASPHALRFLKAVFDQP